MANTPEFHLKLIIGDLTTRLAIVLAENERLQEELVAAKVAQK